MGDVCGMGGCAADIYKVRQEKMVVPGLMPQATSASGNSDRRYFSASDWQSDIRSKPL